MSGIEEGRFREIRRLLVRSLPVDPYVLRIEAQRGQSQPTDFPKTTLFNSRHNPAHLLKSGSLLTLSTRLKWEIAVRTEEGGGNGQRLAPQPRARPGRARLEQR